MIALDTFRRFVELEKTAVLGEALVSPLQNALFKSVLRRGHRDPSMAKRIRQQLPHDVHFLEGPADQAAFVPDKNRVKDILGIDKKVVIGPKDDPHILAHEVGHAKVDEHRIGRYVQHPRVISSSSKIPALATFGGAASGYVDERSGGDGKVRDAAILGGMHAPQLGYEAAASYQGDKMLRALGSSAQDISKYRGSMGRAFGTYALHPVASLVNYGLGRQAGALAARALHDDK